jgi:predicted dinucleotide-binding enzyme
LAKLWEAAGHDVAAFGRDGGDASAADVVVVALPSNAIKDAFAAVRGYGGKPAVDATNAYQGRDESFPSLAHEVKSITGGPVAKAFNLNFAVNYGEIAAQRVPPGQLWCGDEEAGEVTERLIRDAGFEPISAGGLDNARALEEFVMPLYLAGQALGGPVFYRFVRPGEL